MAVLRPHLALTVSDVERSLPFYEALFGRPATKRKRGYAKFEITEPTLNLTLNEGERSELGYFLLTVAGGPEASNFHEDPGLTT